MFSIGIETDPPIGLESSYLIRYRSLTQTRGVSHPHPQKVTVKVIKIVQRLYTCWLPSIVINFTAVKFHQHFLSVFFFFIYYSWYFMFFFLFRCLSSAWCEGLFRRSSTSAWRTASTRPSGKNNSTPPSASFSCFFFHFSFSWPLTLPPSGPSSVSIELAYNCNKKYNTLLLLYVFPSEKRRSLQCNKRQHPTYLIT